MKRTFLKYQHLERWGTSEVEGIEFGECYVFPKIDGTNASVWLDSGHDLCAGSRKRHLSLDSDNAGFYEWVLNNSQGPLGSFLLKHPHLRLFGEWLVPHSLKTYRDDAWRKFYIFDVAVDKDPSELTHAGDSKLRYLHFEEYSPLLRAAGLDYIDPIAIIQNPTYERIMAQLPKNNFLIKDGKGTGEGVVVKNYAFINKYGRQTWAKVVTSEFKEKHTREMGATRINEKPMVEAAIANEFVTTALCKKVKAKISVDEDGWSSKMIPRLLNTVYYDVVKEDAWSFVKKHRDPSINFKTLKHLVFSRVKECLPMVF